jgi:hypothetical protein
MKLERIVVMSLILVVVLRNISVNYLLPKQCLYTECRHILFIYSTNQGTLFLV